MQLDDQEVQRLVDELSNLREHVTDRSETVEELRTIRRTLEDIKGNMNSGGGD